MQLTIGHESAVAAEIERHGGAGDLLRLVGIAEKEFAGREWPPIALAVEGAIAFYLRGLIFSGILPLENRIANTIGEAEMLLRYGHILAILLLLDNEAQVLILPRHPVSRGIVSGE